MLKVRNLCYCLLVGALCVAFAPRAVALDEPVRLDSGLVSGVAGSSPEVRVYKGIPFAAPPVGDLRWKAPQPVKSWSGVRAATAFGPACPQPPDPITQFMNMKKERQSEDCLYLNVWTPAKTGSDKLPVMVWIHGGAFLNGSGSLPFYDGEKLAEQGVIVVTINYRLGPFGFFAHPLLSKESPHHVSGNYGLLDQIAALHWVQKNIAAFGGDTQRVTIFGESAGAMSVCCLMASPLTKGLFQRAIAESGSSFARNRHLRETWDGQEPMEQVGTKVASEIVGDQQKEVLATLRAKSADEILQSIKISPTALLEAGIRFGPVIDGYVIPDDPAKIFAEGRQQPVPLIVGTNKDEGTIFTLMAPNVNVDFYQSMVTRMFGKDADAVQKLYPASTNAEARTAINHLIADSFFAAGARYFAETQSHVNKAYLYQYTYVVPDPRFALMGAFHGSEIPRVFGTISAASRTDDDSGKKLSQAIMGAWVRFATTGDPNGGDLPAWPHYETATDSYLEFGTDISAKSGLKKEQIDLFQKIAMERNAHHTDK